MSWIRQYRQQRQNKHQHKEIYLTPPSSPHSLSRHSSDDEYVDNQGCGNVVDCFLDVKVENGVSQVTSRILYQNNTEGSLDDAVFYHKIVSGASVKSVDCFVERSDCKATSRRTKFHSRLERRAVKNAFQEGPYFSCNVGAIESHQDIVIFLRYEHKISPRNGAAAIHLPLPGRLGERMITRQADSIMDWNGPNVFSYIAMNLHVAMPGQIHKISSSTHSIKSTISFNQANIDIENEILLGQDIIDLVVEGDELYRTEMWQTSSARHSSQDSLHSGSTIESAGCQTPLDNQWRDEKLDGNFDHGYILEDYLRDSPTTELRSSNGFLDNITTTKGSNHNILPKGYENGRFKDLVHYNMNAQEYSKHVSGEHYVNNTKPCNKNIYHTWYEEDSDLDDDEQNFYDFDDLVALHSSDVDTCSDEEWDSDVENVDVDIELISAAFEDIFVGTALAVSPGRPRLVTICTQSGEVGEESGIDDAILISKPLSRHMRTPTFGGNIHDEELEAILTSFISQVKRSSNAFLTLSEEFADTIQVDIDTLVSHPGAQSRRLSLASRNFREGIWANILALHFLQFVLDFEGVASNNPLFKTRLDWLINSLENPLLQQEKQITGSMSLMELSELAKDVFPLRDDASFRKSLTITANDLGVYTPPASPTGCFVYDTTLVISAQDQA